MINWKKTVAGIAVGILCVAFCQTLPVYANSDNYPVVQVNSNIEYVNISPEEYAFRNKNTGGSMYVVEDLKSNCYRVSCIEDTFKNTAALNPLWQGYSIGRNTVANVGFVNYSMRNLESGYMEEVALHSVHQVQDIADGVGELPNHFETHYIFNEINGKLNLAGICKLNNAGQNDFTIMGGQKFIHGTEVRVREAPNTNCNVLGYFENNESVYVYGYTNIDYSKELPNGWAYVKRNNGQVGYVAAQFLMRAPLRGM